jgi:hypothetical protein
MKWKQPPAIKIYEALGAVVDSRVEVLENKAKAHSSSGNKFYDVIYNSANKAIMVNDNGSYWKGYLGYPAIAFLMKTGLVSYDEKLGNLLKGIAWKDINQKFKNNFDKTLGHILSLKTETEKEALKSFVIRVDAEIKELNLSLLGEKTLPPDGY